MVPAPEKPLGMGCYVCGKDNAEFRSRGDFNKSGVQETRAFCEPCFIATFGDNPITAKLQAHARQLHERALNEKIEQDMRKLRTHFRPTLEEIVAKNPRFPFEAYELIYASLTRATYRVGIPPQHCGRHASAAELVRACAAQARQAGARTRRPARGLSA